MVMNTKLFGSIELDESKIITFEQGMIGFEYLKNFVILYKQEKQDKHTVSWLQSIEEPQLAFPIIDPFLVKEDYNPEINDTSLNSLGDFKREDISVMVTLAVPEDITKMSCNMKAPVVINTATKRGAQIIVENKEYKVKYLIYDILNSKKKIKEEC